MTDIQPHIVCLEGNAAAGKSSCCATIAARLGANILPEYTETLDPAHRGSLMRSFEGGLRGADVAVWHLAEERRSALLGEATCSSVFMDTSLVSIVAFESARQEFGCGGNVTEIVSTYLDLLSLHRVTLPQTIVHLTVDEDERLARIARRGTCHPFLRRGDVSRHMDCIRLAFFEHHLPRSCWASMDTTTLSPAETAERVADILQTLDAAPISDAVLSWLKSFPLRPAMSIDR